MRKVLLFLILPLTFCQKGSSDGSSQNGGLSDTVQVIISSNRTFIPPNITIESGTTVTWKSASFDTHTVTAIPELANQPGSVLLPAGAEPFTSGLLFYNDTYSHTFTVPGQYRYFDRFHEFAGMIGLITVTEKQDGGAEP